MLRVLQEIIKLKAYLFIRNAYTLFLFVIRKISQMYKQGKYIVSG